MFETSIHPNSRQLLIQRFNRENSILGVFPFRFICVIVQATIVKLSICLHWIESQDSSIFALMNATGKRKARTSGRIPCL
jgi:hypothetical protein